MSGLSSKHRPWVQSPVTHNKIKEQSCLSLSSIFWSHESICDCDPRHTGYQKAQEETWHFRLYTRSWAHFSISSPKFLSTSCLSRISNLYYPAQLIEGKHPQILCGPRKAINQSIQEQCSPSLTPPAVTQSLAPAHAVPSALPGICHQVVPFLR
jgi:hypothetical protein